LDFLVNGIFQIYFKLKEGKKTTLCTYFIFLVEREGGLSNVPLPAQWSNFFTLD